MTEMISMIGGFAGIVTLIGGSIAVGKAFQRIVTLERDNANVMAMCSICSKELRKDIEELSRRLSGNDREKLDLLAEMRSDIKVLASRIQDHIRLRETAP